ncbi:MAG: hypothetical protein U5Q03_01100 [Bacteroidota bacterium]|nr:hypothetical protein [Bacteroidota bacterium]
MLINTVKHKNILRLLVILFAMPLSMQAQIDIPDDFPFEELQPETIRLYTDRDVYISGETVYFRADCYAPEAAKEILSKVVYIELFKHTGESIVKKKIKLVNSHADNCFRIPHELSSGTYYLRAFTQYSRNFKPAAGSFKVLEVINPQNPPGLSKSSAKELQFFPEFDSLIKGKDNRIAFLCSEALATATDSIILQTYGADTLQKIIDLYGNAGMIYIFPSDSLTHTLKFYLQNHDSILFDIQLPYSSMYMFTEIKQKENRVHFKLKGNKRTPHRYFLSIIHQSGLCVSTKQAITTESDFSYEVGKSKLPAGINYFLLEDDKGDVLFTDAIYHKPESQSINIHLDKQNYSTRQAVKLKIDLQGETALLNVRVVKKGSTFMNFFSNSSLLFNPMFFKDYPVDTGMISLRDRKMTEIAMLVFRHSLNADRTFSRSLLDKKEKLWLPENRGIGISGFLLEKGSEKPVANVPVIGSLLFSVPCIHINNTSDDGSFFLSFNNLQDQQNLFISPFNKDQQIQLLINNDFGAAYPRIRDMGFYPDSAKRRFYEEMYLNAQLTDKFGKKAIPFPKTELPDVYKNMAKEILLSDYIALSSLPEVFKEIIPNARMRKENGKTLLAVLDGMNNIWYDNPLVLLDNVPISDHDILEEIHPAQVRKIGVVSHTSVIGDHFIPGIIYIETFDGKFAGLKMPDNSVFLEYDMFAQGYNFNPLEYQSARQIDNPLPDFRNLLYWDPGIRISGKAEIEFLPVTISRNSTSSLRAIIPTV